MALLKCNNIQDSLQIKDQILRVDDDKLTARLPERQSKRNRAIYNPSSKASLPGRMSSRNRAIFRKDVARCFSYPVIMEQGQLPNSRKLTALQAAYNSIATNKTGDLKKFPN